MGVAVVVGGTARAVGEALADGGELVLDRGDVGVRLEGLELGVSEDGWGLFDGFDDLGGGGDKKGDFSKFLNFMDFSKKSL